MCVRGEGGVSKCVCVGERKSVRWREKQDEQESVCMEIYIRVDMYTYVYIEMYIHICSHVCMYIDTVSIYV